MTMSSRSQKALIIGISGQDGAYLAEFLLQKGYTIAGTSRDAQLCSFEGLRKLHIFDKISIYSASPSDFRSMLTVLKLVQPQEVYNLAGQSSVGLSFDQPVDTFQSIAIANLNVLETLRFFDPSIRYYNAGSSECFGNTSEPATELSPFCPRSPYAVAKSAAFWQVANYREAYNLFACSGVLFNHESPLRPTRFVTRKIILAACEIAMGKRKSLQLGNLNIARDWGLASEYVKAMWLMLQQDKPDDFIIATGHTYTLKEFVIMVFSELGLEWEKYVTTNETLLRPTDILESRACPCKAKQQLGWKAQYILPEIIKLLVNVELKRLEQKK